MNTRRILVVALSAASLATFVSVTPAFASTPPANDELSTATVIPSLPYTVTEDISGATTAPSDPKNCLVSGQQYPITTVWFAYTPRVDTPVDLSIRANFEVQYEVFTYAPQDGLSFYTCNPNVGGSGKLDQSLYLRSGREYVFYLHSWQTSGTVQMSLTVPPPPPNDAFTAATPISTTPFTDYSDTTAATHEAGEPTSYCNYVGFPYETTWYSYTAPFTGQVDTSVDVNQTGIAAWTGAALTSLQ